MKKDFFENLFKVFIPGASYEYRANFDDEHEGFVLQELMGEMLVVMWPFDGKTLLIRQQILTTPDRTESEIKRKIVYQGPMPMLDGMGNAAAIGLLLKYRQWIGG